MALSWGFSQGGGMGWEEDIVNICLFEDTKLGGEITQGRVGGPRGAFYRGCWEKALLMR